MKTFDFNHPDFLKKNTHCQEWLKANHNKPITEEEFVAAMQAMKQFRKGASYKYQPSHLRGRYKQLKENFGFFPSLK